MTCTGNISILVVATVFFFSNSNVSGFVSLEDFFPFGPENGDVMLTEGDDTFIRVSLKQEFQYFNTTHQQLFVNVNGAISFIAGVSQFTPTCGPLTVPMIAPFWTDIDTRRGGFVYYRESTKRELLNKATTEIQKAFPEFWSLTLGWLFIATWNDIAFYGASNVCGGLDRRNTFQVIVTTDGTYSFTIFYYNNITWTTGTHSESGGDCRGLGGNPAKAGFDVGDQKTFYEIPGTCTDRIKDIANTSNVKEPGKWIFRIDDSLVSASCKNENRGKLRINPTFVSVLGHVPISLRGPCLDGATNATCTFHDPEGSANRSNVSGTILVSDQSVVCMVPYLYTQGRIKVELRVTYWTRNDDNSSEGSGESIHYGYIYSTEPDHQVSVVWGEDMILAMEWNPKYFAEMQEKTNNGSGPETNLQLIIAEFNGAKWKETVVIDSLYNNGTFSKRMGEAGIKDPMSAYVFKLEKKTLRSKKDTSKSNVMKNYLFNAFSPMLCIPAIFTASCDIWYESDEGLPNDILPCPPLLSQAIVDGNFERDVMLQVFHEGGEASFRQKFPSPSGAGQQCIYTDGRLYTKYPFGGTADKISPNKSTLKHWKEDVAPWCQCCYFTRKKRNFESSCGKYMEKRPTDSGSKYQPPRPARAVGDPHITTFDHFSYTFNGVGEFWMVRSEGFSMQARMERYVAPDGTPKNASVFTAFAFKEGERSSDGGHVQVSVIPSGIIVLLDGEAIELLEEDGGRESRSVVFHSVSIDIVSNSKISVAFPSGFSFSFTKADDASLNLIGAAMNNRLGKTDGLLGYFDGNLNNDLRDQDGNELLINSSSKDIHYNFGLKWMVEAEESLFQYPIGRNYSHYYHPDFLPTFSTPDSSLLSKDVLELCGGSQECLFDYSVTGSSSFSVATRNTSVEFEEILTIVSEKPAMCEEIFAPDNGFLVSVNFFVGSNITFGCKDGYELYGPNFLICENATRSDGDETYKWNSNAKVSCNARKTNNKTTYYFIGSIVATIIVLVIGLYLYQYRKKKHDYERCAYS